MIDDVPRRNGELAFDAPWEPRVFGLAAGVVETSYDGDWEPFRQRLIGAIAAEPDRAYWLSWTAALEDLLLARGVLAPGDLAGLPAPYASGHGAPHPRS